MDIFIPIGIGFLTNLFVFVISKAFKQTTKRSLLICLFSFLVVLITAFIIGSWLGMGIGVISLGMLVFVIIAGLSTALSIIKNVGD